MQQHKHHHRTSAEKVLLSSVHLNVQSLGFHPQTQKLELILYPGLVQHNKHHHRKVLLSSIYLNDRTLLKIFSIHRWMPSSLEDEVRSQDTLFVTAVVPVAK